jgi:signal transduction histidine kinase/CheY-like chemotaxis protein
MSDARLSPDAFARFFEMVHEGVHLGTLSGSGSTTTAANPYLRLLFGYPADAPAEDVRPFDPARFVDPAARTALLERLRRDGAVSDYLLRLRRADGAPLWIEVTGQAQPGPTPDSLQVDALLRDVSERRKLEEETRDLYQQLLQAEKMAVLGQTISGVAHELNNPLASILMWAERMARKQATPEIRQGLDTILHEAERAARIVRHLLTFARKRHSTRATVDVNDVVRDTLALRQHEQRLGNIALIDALAVGLPHVFADPHQLQQVLLNLVINAEQAMTTTAGRGTLVVRTWHDGERDVVLLEVSDDGPGLAPEVLPRIFDPFFTTKEVGQGTGLGLTVAYAIVQEHGGAISAHSAPGEGATFRIELPTASTKPAKKPEPALGPSPEPRAGAAVLLVEDEPGLASAVVECLGDAGYVVTHAGDGQAGLEATARRTFDAIICDLKMPRLDGPAFYRSIVEHYPALARRVIFVTGDVAGTDAERFLVESGCRWLPKPFRLSELLRVVREVTG